MTNPVYVETKEALESVRRISNLRYVYTAKRGDDGVLVYVVDGLPESAGDDFRYPGRPHRGGDLRRTRKGAGR